MDKTSWSVETKKIFNGILLFSLSWIAYGIFDPIESLFSGVDTLASWSDSPNPTEGVGAVFSIITYLLLIGIGVGYILTIVGLGKFRAILEAADGKAIGSVHTAFILALIAVVLIALPLGSVVDFVGDIVYFIAIILMLVGYSKLNGSSTFAGKSGASTLFVAMILILVGWVLDFIPLIGDWIEALLTIIAYIMTLVGWKTIKNAGA
jgi:hypothetical protein